MTVGTVIKVLLVAQFMLVAAVPCKCLMTQLASTAVVAAQAEPEPCSRSCCSRHANSNAKSVNSDQICVRSSRRGVCPGKLLPDLALPPTSDERLATLLAPPSGLVSLIDLHAATPSALPHSTWRARPATCPGDQSLLRLHCALVV